MAVTQFSSLKPIKEDEPPWSFEEDDDAYVYEMDVMPEQREE
jgi:hypothetical protein